MKKWLKLRKAQLFDGVLACVCIVVGWEGMHSSSVVLGILGSFVLVTGIQIVMCVVGLRFELFGTAPDTDYATLNRLFVEDQKESAITAAEMLSGLMFQTEQKRNIRVAEIPEEQQEERTQEQKRERERQ
jgi:hypothetical protein